jgi:hypothetical protein
MDRRAPGGSRPAARGSVAQARGAAAENIAAPGPSPDLRDRLLASERRLAKVADRAVVPAHEVMIVIVAQHDRDRAAASRLRSQHDPRARRKRAVLAVTPGNPPRHHAPPALLSPGARCQRAPGGPTLREAGDGSERRDARCGTPAPRRVASGVSRARARGRPCRSGRRASRAGSPPAVRAAARRPSAISSRATPAGSHSSGISSPWPKSTSVSPAITAPRLSIHSTMSLGSLPGNASTAMGRRSPGAYRCASPP